MPASAQEGRYKLRVEGRLQESAMGNIWQNETDIELYNKQASLFMQMSKPLYRQGQMGKRMNGFKQQKVLVHLDFNLYMYFLLFTINIDK